MTNRAIIDTGPLVAFLDRREKHHAWVVDQVRQLAPPLLVCEPVLTEASYLVQAIPGAQQALMGLLESRGLSIDFTLAEHLAEVRAILKKYRDRPASLADACLIRMSELNETHAVLSLDSEFRVYRKHGRQAIELIAP